MDHSKKDPYLSTEEICTVCQGGGGGAEMRTNEEACGCKFFQEVTLCKKLLLVRCTEKFIEQNVCKFKQQTN